MEYLWTFGDGGTSTDPNPDHSYSQAGNWLWTLTASVGGLTCSRSGMVIVDSPRSGRFSMETGGRQTIEYTSGYEEFTGHL